MNTDRTSVRFGRVGDTERRKLEEALTPEEHPAEPFDVEAALEGAGIAMPEEIEIEVPDFDREPEQDDPVRPLDETTFYPPGTPEPDAQNPKDLLGMKKPDLSLIPPAALLHEAQAMMDGARKYGPYNWREKAVKMRIYIAAAQRHLSQLLDGEDFDPISGVHHAGHARACLGIILDAVENGTLVDDRPLPGAAPRLIREYENRHSSPASPSSAG